MAASNHSSQASSPGRQPTALRRGRHFTSAAFGAPTVWGEYRCVHPRHGEIAGKVFLGAHLGLTGMETSFGVLAPGQSISFVHAHEQNEELYVVLSGEGEMQVDGERVPLTAGTAVRIAPAGERCWRATGVEPMAYLVVQAKEGSLAQATSADGILCDRPVQW